MEIKVMTNLMAANEEQAKKNQELLDRHGVVAINIMGSPGAGKTTLLERTLDLIKDRVRVAVIEGDIYTAKDARRIEAHGVPVIQINTGGACHLDSQMVAQVLDKFDLANLDLLIVENVGNLVCPVEFNVGEHYKIAVLSITEGDDKPLKYPLIFKESAAMVLNKLDLLDFTDVNLEQLQGDVKSINPNIHIYPISCRDRRGLEEWVDWLLSLIKKKGS